MSTSGVAVPSAIAEVLPEGLPTHTLTGFDQADIAVGQGLRTGCNAFFYVSAVEIGAGDTVVETARCLAVAALRGAEHRASTGDTPTS